MSGAGRRGIVLGLLLVALALVASAARAVDACGGALRDADDLLDPADEADITEVIERLDRVGVRTLVLLARSFGEDDLEAVLEQAILDCDPLTTDRGWAADVLGIAVAVDDRLTGIHQGGAFPYLDAADTHVDTDVMNPRFAEGRYGQGIEEGLQALLRIREDRLADLTAEADHGDDGGVPVLPFLGGGALVVGAAAVGSDVLRRRRARAAAHQRVVALEASLAQRVIDLERNRDIAVLDTDRVAGRLGLSEAEPLHRRAADVRAAVGSVLTTWAALSSQVDPSTSATVEVSERLAGEFATVDGRLQEQAADVSALAAETERVETLLEELPGRLDKTEDGIAQAHTAVAVARAAGYRTGPADEDVHDARAALRRAREAHEQRLPDAADVHLSLARQAADDAHRWATGIEQMRQRMAAEADALDARAAELVATVDRAAADMAALEQRFAVPAWEMVAGNGSEAEREIDSSREAITASRSAQDLRVQDWDAADEALDAAEEDLEDAATLLAAISAHRAQLEERSAALPAALEAAGVAVEEAVAVTTRHAADVTDALEQRAAGLRTTLARVRRDAAVDRPDPTAATNAARRIQVEAGEIAATAADEHGRAEQARTAAQRAMEDASREIDRLRDYLRGHRRYATSALTHRLQESQMALSRARTGDDPMIVRNHADTARRIAGDALTEAMRVVRVARDRSRSAYDRSGGVWRGPSGGRRSGGFGSGLSSGRSRGGASARSRGGSASRSRGGGSSSRRRSSGGRSGRTSRW